VGVCQRSQYCRSEVAQHGKPLTLLATTWVRRIVFAQKLAPSVGGEALKKVVKKRQDFANTEGCAQNDSVEQQKSEGRRKKTIQQLFFFNLRVFIQE